MSRAADIAETVDVVMRCRDEMPHTRRALDAVAAQVGVIPRILFIDCHSSDGSREAAERAGVRIHDFEPARYIPGLVLNLAMEMTRSAIVAFVNADAIALHRDALERLIAPIIADPEVVASYGMQCVRAGASALTRLDHARAFPDDAPLQTRYGSFFSMAASAIRRDAWQRLRFDDTLRYSEDVDWTRRARALGWRVAYVPAARFEHSHDYDLRGQFKRRRGEGGADTLIYHLGRPSLTRDLLRPLAGTMWRDARARVVSPRSVAVRLAQAAGYFAGRREAGWR